MNNSSSQQVNQSKDGNNKRIFTIVRLPYKRNSNPIWNKEKDIILINEFQTLEIDWYKIQNKIGYSMEECINRYTYLKVLHMRQHENQQVQQVEEGNLSSANIITKNITIPVHKKESPQRHLIRTLSEQERELTPIKSNTDTIDQNVTINSTTNTSPPAFLKINTNLPLSLPSTPEHKEQIHIPSFFSSPRKNLNFFTSQKPTQQVASNVSGDQKESSVISISLDQSIPSFTPNKVLHNLQISPLSVADDPFNWSDNEKS